MSGCGWELRELERGSLVGGGLGRKRKGASGAPSNAASRAACDVFRVFDTWRGLSELSQLQPPTPRLPPERPAATMSDEKQPSANLIRMWRVWRTTKEMMHDRVGCAAACTSYRQRR